METGDWREKWIDRSIGGNKTGKHKSERVLGSGRRRGSAVEAGVSVSVNGSGTRERESEREAGAKRASRNGKCGKVGGNARKWGKCKEGAENARKWEKIRGNARKWEEM